MISKKAIQAISQLGAKQPAVRAISSSVSALNQAAAAPALPADKMEVFVNGEAVVVPKNFTVLQACDAAGVDVPRFCYHQRLSIAGNCRMCLVEIEKAPKPVASCAFPAGPGMKIKTDTPVIKKAREGVMEFLLINHPLDCPICDQGGECDLQDQAMIFGSDRSRFIEYKRAVADKNLGPLIKTSMNRCIHCTRCVRFTHEVAGTSELGITGRGRDSEVGTYIEKLHSSELSGNVIDLCPVGALLSKPYAFTARSWELKGTETIDVSDALGSNIKVDCRGTEVMRITPRLNDAINEEWLSDKGRFQYDGLKRQRLNTPLVKGAKGLENATWSAAFDAIRTAIAGAKGNELKAIAGKLADAESMIALKDLFNKLGSGNLIHEDGSATLSADVRSSYIANTTIASIEKADVILLVGTNPRFESPVFNARLRKVFLDGAKVGLVGEKVDLTYAYQHLGADVAALESLASGKGAFFEALKGAKNPVVIVGSSVLRRDDREAVLKTVNDLVDAAGVVKEGWNGFNVLHDNASRVAALDIGFVPSASARTNPVPAKVVYLLGSDDFKDEEIPADAFVIYQGHHGDKGAARANVVLPGAAYTEKASLFANTEGRVQTTRTAVPVLGDAREDWKIIRALSEVVGQQLPYDSQPQVRARLAEVAPHFAEIGKAESALWLNGQYFKGVKDLVAKAARSTASLATNISNYYMTDAISRASRTMAKCTAVRQQ
uniref:75 kDa n=1 Tax=Polytomella sp. Pringsheim 198.80 TaxID=37502 RepID=UPI001E1E23C8|nr:Chain G, kDa [Polytomella sp. Pringsheim 198.80]7ARD_G Chain G, kDa [Polytomella sp. Pringsheim 198.80]|eukprot:CAMPEP_0175082916 /NCGR_PEP_ID=MMETSP0052_2-20121109/27033_1 /TAXON_ID=51329 ORGANISM="Polytomella parva, Strain SAG 63-3" /NCGR_SAMPLE_ID=MMETSP0052_2 /ASSEMBLY_ACC=CAM_ASM_000194 /LENGTH=720 /DNA_ID=CAMNT_0016354189 /DNA_START=61 /DNA_END=2223 /DNA_ORIENTATION=+